ncbi:DUF1460 domain-containing protein [Myxococcota bacterium]|nr:DUF1460 domain-containing protein [Myxococcota bacterium]MBU1379547.1 DUF1460 domain-containing protein [Myxococcota bacterium]MBU1495265.1 DUF1460 domain-containing protein [Myxococcota bacterium]
MTVFLLSLFINFFNPPAFSCKGNTNTKISEIWHSGGIDRLISNQKKFSLTTRLDFWTDFFMGTGYRADPLGETVPPDNDPLWNPCEMDCETYVEMVLALTFSQNHKEVTRWMKFMRYYDGETLYNKRFFTMNLSWIPENLKLGYMFNVNNRISKKISRIGRIIIPESNWKTEWKNRLSLMGEKAPRGLSLIKYISVSELEDNINKIPTPSLAFLVGAVQSNNPFLITHMGFILKNKKNRLVFRHASGTVGRKRVEERDLREYLKMLKTYFGKKTRRYILGMTIYQITEPPVLKK